jgi:hypothetical protein
VRFEGFSPPGPQLAGDSQQASNAVKLPIEALILRWKQLTTGKISGGFPVSRIRQGLA